LLKRGRTDRGKRSRKKRNIIQLITRISVVGIATITASLIVLLSAFNGIEKMIEDLYTDYDADITVRPTEGKTFNEDRIDITQLKKIDGVRNYSRAVEEVVILKHDEKWVNANLIGVDDSFLEIARMGNHILNGDSVLYKDSLPVGIMGATLLDKLEAYVPENVGEESVICYVPRRKMKIQFGKNPFRTERITISGKMNYNRDVNAKNLLIPLDLSKELLGYNKQISALYIDVDDDHKNEDVKAQVQKLAGKDFQVKTNFEKNELIYQTSRSEKLIVLYILLFIFILAAFNLVASLNMLFVEKLDNIGTLQSFGASRRFIFSIFFIEGLLISGAGILIGLIVGYAVCYLQIATELVTMPNSGGEPFPIAISLSDGALILSCVLALSVLFSYFPVKFLIRRNIGSTVIGK